LYQPFPQNQGKADFGFAKQNAGKRRGLFKIGRLLKKKNIATKQSATPKIPQES
jgi:hypothetical protein